MKISKQNMFGKNGAELGFNLFQNNFTFIIITKKKSFVNLVFSFKKLVLTTTAPVVTATLPLLLPPPPPFHAVGQRFNCKLSRVILDCT